jgi:WD40 repeat protein
MPHVLIGHENQVGGVAVDPTGKWIASTELNKPVVRLWPMPEGQPLQTLPHDELMNRLSKLTNVRVVADKNSSTGYRVEFTPFPGW